MILLKTMEDVNTYFNNEDKVYDIIFPDDMIGAATPRFAVLKFNSVETMVMSMMYRDAGEALQSLGYNFVMPIFNELPDALEASQNLLYPIAVVGLKDKEVNFGDISISEKFKE